MAYNVIIGSAPIKQFTLLAFIVVSDMAAAAPKADSDKGKQIVTTVCASYYAVDGNSGIAMCPKLSAQHATYIYGQAEAIKKSKRATDTSGMVKPVATGLLKQDTHNVATYYNKQQPKPSEISLKEKPELGTKIYRGGIADKRVPACMSCHGPNGAGIPGGGTDIVAYPCLGGQHRSYTVGRMRFYKSGQRASTIIADIAGRMSGAGVGTVTDFIQGLH